MTGEDVLGGAIKRIKSRGMASGCAIDSTGRICPAAALVETAGGDKDLRGGRFHEKGYLEARRAFTSVLGIPDSYQAIADWADTIKVREGSKVKVRTTGDAVGAMRRAIKKLQEEKQASAA